MNDIGSWLGFATALLLAIGKGSELLKLFVDKKRREPLIRQADLDRKEHTKELRRLASKIESLEQWRAKTGEFMAPRKPNE